MASMLNAEAKTISKHVGYPISEWAEADPLVMNEAWLLVVYKRLGEPKTVEEIDAMPVMENDKAMTEGLRRLGFEDDPEDEETPKEND